MAAVDSNAGASEWVTSEVQASAALASTDASAGGVGSSLGGAGGGEGRVKLLCNSALPPPLPLPPEGGEPSDGLKQCSRAMTRLLS